MTRPGPLPATPRCADQAGTHDLDDGQGLRLRVIEQGGTWVSCRVHLPGRDAAGQAAEDRELLLGFDDPASYQRNGSYLGAALGRYANRIAHGRLATLQPPRTLARAPGQAHHLHGGPDSFSHRAWQRLDQGPRHLRLGLHSPEGDQGYPGAMRAEMLWQVGPVVDAGADAPSAGGPSADDTPPPYHQITLTLRATVTAPCPVSLGHHPYFQLDGRAQDVRDQALSLAATHHLPVDADGAPVADPQPLAGSRFDLRAGAHGTGPSPGPHTLRERLAAAGASASAGAGARTDDPVLALDNAFLLDPACAPLARPAAQLASADRRVRLDLFTTLPALQVYTGAHLGGGTAGCTPAWPDFSGLAVEPQFLPDSPNHPHWPQPSCWLQPGQAFEHRIRYRIHVDPRP